jgi:predicted nuclease with TOPRIM domain
LKALYIYNPHSSIEVGLIERVKTEMGGYVELLDVASVPNELKKLVRATPAIVFAPDYLQGEELTNESVDSGLLLISEMYKELEADELAIHNQETQRLDQFVNGEKQVAIDDYTMDLIIGGVI